MPGDRATSTGPWTMTPSSSGGSAAGRRCRVTTRRPSRQCPLEAVEDQVEPELELVAVVVAGLQDVLDGHSARWGYSLGGEQPKIISATSAVSSAV